MLISNGKVIHGFYMCSPPQMLNSGNEAFSARVQKILWLRLISPFAPNLGLFVLLFCKTRCLAETDEPWKKKKVRSCLLLPFLF